MSEYLLYFLPYSSIQHVKHIRYGLNVRMAVNSFVVVTFARSTHVFCDKDKLNRLSRDQLDHILNLVTVFDPIPCQHTFLLLLELIYSHPHIPVLIVMIPISCHMKLGVCCSASWNSWTPSGGLTPNYCDEHGSRPDCTPCQTNMNR